MFEIYCLEIPASIFVAVFIGKYISRWYKNLDRHCLKYLQRHLCKTYFCGYPVSEVYAKLFFVRYRRFADVGFCYTTSALSMLAMRRNLTSRLVYGELIWPRDGLKINHRWLEFRYAGSWYVVDPHLFDNFDVKPRTKYYQFFKVKVLKTCSYSEFWSYPIMHEFHCKLSQPETSYLFYELFTYLSARPDGTQFCSNIQTVHLQWNGKDVSGGFYLADQGGEVLFSSRIMDDFMKKPTRLQPKARSIRLAFKTKNIWCRNVYGSVSDRINIPLRGAPLSADAIPPVSKCFI